MIFSMTGFATASVETETGTLTLELRAVNSRYFDLQLRLPDDLRTLETTFREAISAVIARGKVDCRASYTAHQINQNLTQLNLPLLHQLAELDKVIRDILPEATPLGVADILRWNGIIQTASTGEGVLSAAALEALHQALENFSASRAREGKKLVLFLEQRITQIFELCAKVAPRIPAAIAVFEEKLVTRLRAALKNDDDNRLLQEVNLFAGKIDVSEELSRLHTHLNEVRRVLTQGGTVGKRLDFLMQELHREANTLGAKSVDAEITYVAMEIKLLTEQMREQIQNIE